MHEVVCMSCDERAPMERALDRVRAGEDDPPCRTCGGILKSATISFGQNLVAEDLERASEAARRCDLLLAVGSTLAVYPVADVVPWPAWPGAQIVIVNGERDGDGRPRRRRAPRLDQRGAARDWSVRAEPELSADVTASDRRAASAGTCAAGHAM